MLNMGNIQHVLILMRAKFIEASIDIEPYHSINVFNVCSMKELLWTLLF